MTERLYYNDPFLHVFDARVTEVAAAENGRTGVVLDRTAFYPTSGGQPFDTGVLNVAGSAMQVAEVTDRESDGAIVHFMEAPAGDLKPGVIVHGAIDAARRRDHMQQHSGQHVLSAAFVRLLNAPTVSFHLGEESCSIDLAIETLDAEQVRSVEQLANDVVTEDRPVDIRYATREQAEGMGLRKLPPRTGEIRLIDIRDFDLTACGGTHVRSTGQIGAILLRKRDKVKQGIRVEFVCGLRAVRTSRADYETLASAAELVSGHPRDLPETLRKNLDELKSAAKTQHKLLEQLAQYEARELLPGAETVGAHRFLAKVFSDRDAAYAKSIARQLAAASGAVVAAIASEVGQPTIVLACSAGAKVDCGAILKQALAAAGGRGGGTRDMAQGGVADPGKLAEVLQRIKQLL
jgi:alanyl-tRNA synthetase